jgi:hypothetical protein
MNLYNISIENKAISSWILVFNWRSFVGRMLYTLHLGWLNEKKSHTDKSGDLGDQLMLSKREMILLPKSCRMVAINGVIV